MNSRNLFLHLHPRSCLPPSGWGFSPPCLELLALLQVTLFLKVIPEALLCEGFNKPPIAWVIYHPCTHIYTRARPSPTHIYTHVHVHPLHTYMHTCTSNTCTHIYTRARLPPTDIYTHMHVHPLHTYIHTCTSNPCTHICTRGTSNPCTDICTCVHPTPAHLYAHPYIFFPALTPAEFSSRACTLNASCLQRLLKTKPPSSQGSQ